MTNGITVTADDFPDYVTALESQRDRLSRLLDTAVAKLAVAVDQNEALQAELAELQEQHEHAVTLLENVVERL